VRIRLWNHLLSYFAATRVRGSAVGDFVRNDLKGKDTEALVEEDAPHLNAESACRVRHILFGGLDQTQTQPAIDNAQICWLSIKTCN
jgi:hypothetical protein